MGEIEGGGTSFRTKKAKDHAPAAYNDATVGSSFQRSSKSSSDTVVRVPTTRFCARTLFSNIVIVVTQNILILRGVFRKMFHMCDFCVFFDLLK